METKKIALLIGNGGRLKCIHNNLPKNAKVATVVSFKKESEGINWAKNNGIESKYFRISDYKKSGKTREDLEKELAEYLISKKIDLIVMAGWMLVMSDLFLKQFPMKVINIHPALNPSFPGTQGVQDAWNYGAKVTGATVHFVPDSGIDSGPIIAQKSVEITNEDSFDSLLEKVHQAEEEILPRAINWFLNDQLVIENRRVIIK